MKTKNKLKTALLFVIFIFFLCTSLQAGVTGKISGVIKDRETGEPLPGVTVKVLGTNLGASTDLDGSYFIINIPAGRYTVEASVIGYVPVKKEKAFVVPDLTSEVNFDLTVQAVELGRVITVTAERPLIEKDMTATTHVITSDEIEVMPVRGVQQLTQLQAGVVTGDNRGNRLVQIRGGRPGEVAYFIDGFNTQDIVTGGQGAGVNHNAISEIVVFTGGFNAEYGQSMSGVVNTITKEGGNTTSGGLELRTDEFMGSKHSYGYNNFNFSLGGPFFSKRLKYFISSEYQIADDASPSAGWDGPLPQNDLKRISGTGKLNYQLRENMRLKLGYTESWTKRRFFDILWKYNPEHMYRGEYADRTGYVSMVHNVSPRTFYTFSTNYLYTKTERGDDKQWTNYNSYVNTVFWDDSLYGPDGREDTESYGDNKRQDGSNIFYLPGVNRRVYSKRQSEYYGVKFDIVSQVTKLHQIKAGAESRFYTVRWFNIDLPWRANPFGDNYDKDYYLASADSMSHGTPYKPKVAGIYLQDKMEFEGMIINAGVRYDLLDPAAKSFVDQMDVNRGTENTLKDYQLSPRLGISFPVSDDAVFHFNYGYFFQPPQLRFLYEGVADAVNYIQTGNAIIGDPGLQSEKTVAYEAGVTKKLSNSMKFSATGFFKDINGLIDTRLVTGLQRYVIYINADYASVKGVEFILEKRREGFVGGKISYTLSKATGTGSYQREGYYDYITSSAGLEIVFPKTEFPLDFDQRHTIAANLDIRAGKNEGAKLFRNSGIDFVVRVGSGLPYTPRTPVAFNLQGLGKATGDINSARQPWTWRVDMKVNKGFDLGLFETTCYLEVINLLNRKNVTRVYESSGKPDTDGVLELFEETDPLFSARYNEAVNDPANYDVPRMVRLGLCLNF